jgi:hypothetical protein
VPRCGWMTIRNVLLEHCASLREWIGPPARKKKRPPARACTWPPLVGGVGSVRDLDAFGEHT